MKVRIDGQPTVTLGPDEFVAAGGEGKVYALGDLALKLFDDPKLAPSKGKLRELGRIVDPRVLVPRGCVTSSRGTRLGFSMPLVEGASPLARVCTRSFQRRQRLSTRRLREIAEAMREVVDHVHAAGVVIVDLSDNNVLLGADRRTPYFIDVDSWQTAAHTATAVTPTIRDPQAAGPRFAPGSDWFSYGILVFSMLVGIHPYKGKHPDVKGVTDRMREGLSVFDARVRVPPACRDLDVLPNDFAQWCKEVFTHQHRDPPPPVKTGRRRARRTSTGAPPPPSAVEFDATILDVVRHEGTTVVRTSTSLFADGRRIGDNPPSAVGLWVAPGGATEPSTLVMVHHDLDAHRLWLSLPGTTDPDVAVPIAAREVRTRPDGLFVRTTQGVAEVLLRTIGRRRVASTKLRARILPRASQLFDGVVWQSIEGATMVSLLQPTATVQLRVPELDAATIVDAAWAGDALVVLTTREGRYDQWTLKLDAGAHGPASYRAVRRPDVEPREIAWAYDEGADDPDPRTRRRQVSAVWSAPADVGRSPPPTTVPIPPPPRRRCAPADGDWRPVPVAGGVGWVCGRVLYGGRPPATGADRGFKRGQAG